MNTTAVIGSQLAGTWYRSVDGNPFLAHLYLLNGYHISHHWGCGWQLVICDWGAMASKNTLQIMKRFVHNSHLSMLSLKDDVFPSLLYWNWSQSIRLSLKYQLLILALSHSVSLGHLFQSMIRMPLSIRWVANCIRAAQVKLSGRSTAWIRQASQRF